MKIPRFVLLACLPLLFVASPGSASRMTALPFELNVEYGETYSFESLIFKTPMFEVAPFGTHGERNVPGFTDPMGIGADPELNVFSGEVQNMDLLGDFSVEDKSDVAAVAVPPDALKGLDYREDLLTPILNGERRAYDASLLDIKGAKVREFMGVPVTSETSPLSLAGFGLVTEYMQPIRTHWTKCPKPEKRARVMDDLSPLVRKRIKPNPAVCFPM